LQKPLAALHFPRDSRAVPKVIVGVDAMPSTKSILMGVGLGLLALFVANNVSAIGNLVKKM
jgi:hypothetical protein